MALTIRLLAYSESMVRHVGPPLKRRRQLGAEELGAFPSTFRKLYEAGIILDMALRSS